MKERQQSSHGREHGNQFVQLMFENQERRQFPELPVAQQYRNVLQAEHQQVTRDAEGDFSQHGVCVGMPEGEPGPQRLPDVDHQDRDRAAVADESHDHGGVEDGFQFDALQDVDEEPGEECARAQCNNAEIQENPQAEREAVIHVGLVQAVEQAECGRVNAAPQQHGPRTQPCEKARQGSALRAARDPSGIGEDRTSHVAPPKLEANLVPQGLSPTPRSICNRAWAQSRAEPAAGTPGPNALPSQLDHSHWPSLQNEWHS